MTNDKMTSSPQKSENILHRMSKLNLSLKLKLKFSYGILSSVLSCAIELFKSFQSLSLSLYCLVLITHTDTGTVIKSYTECIGFPIPCSDSAFDCLDSSIVFLTIFMNCESSY
jgi:hypothetical protein